MPKTFAERKPKKITPDYLSNAALYYLQRFAASCARLREVLLRKVARRQNLKSVTVEEVQVWLPEIEKLLERYKEAGLINDAALADAHVAGMRRSGGSARGIAVKLRQKGFAADTIADALAGHEAEEGASDADAIQKFMKKKKLGPFRAANKPADEKQIKREIAALLRAGFDYALVRSAMAAQNFMEV